MVYPLSTVACVVVHMHSFIKYFDRGLDFMVDFPY